jgi:hypothetical protein
MRVFLDASALTKSYIPEPGTAEVTARCAEAEEVILSVIAVPEVASAFNRIRREGRLSDDHYRSLKQQLAQDAENATVLELTESVVDGAIRCLERSPLRASDAIHIASALEIAPDLFLSGDRRQCEAATAMGLKVEYVAL